MTEKFIMEHFPKSKWAYRQKIYDENMERERHYFWHNKIPASLFRGAALAIFFFVVWLVWKFALGIAASKGV